MKLIIAGSRTLFVSTGQLLDLINLFRIDLHGTEIVSGGCSSGPDATSKLFYSHFKVEDNLKYKEFPADWGKHGKAAGPIRNKQMAAYGDALLLIWDGESKGSKHMREEMLKLKKPVYEVILKKHNV